MNENNQSPLLEEVKKIDQRFEEFINKHFPVINQDIRLYFPNENEKIQTNITAQ